MGDGVPPAGRPAGGLIGSDSGGDPAAARTGSGNPFAGADARPHVDGAFAREEVALAEPQREAVGDALRQPLAVTEPEGDALAQRETAAEPVPLAEALGERESSALPLGERERVGEME